MLGSKSWSRMDARSAVERFGTFEIGGKLPGAIVGTLEMAFNPFSVDSNSITEHKKQ